MPGQFITPLHVEQVNDKTWALISPLQYRSDMIGLVSVPIGFQTDFCSVPRLPLAFMIDGNCGQRAGVIHDYCYSDPRIDRKTADAVLKEALEACGVGWFRRWTMWIGVRVGGWAYKKNQ